jgi:hypothetical protein
VESSLAVLYVGASAALSEGRIMMTKVNAKERAICKRRGHELEGGWDADWSQCRWCGMWVREVTTIEERASAPPMAERSVLSRLRSKLPEVK